MDPVQQLMEWIDDLFYYKNYLKFNFRGYNNSYLALIDLDRSIFEFWSSNLNLQGLWPIFTLIKYW